MLDRGAFGALRVRQAFAQLPEGVALRKAACHRRIADQPVGERRAQNVLGLLARVLARAAGRDFEQHIPWGLPGQRTHRLRNMRERELQRPAGDQFEGGQAGAGTVEWRG